MSSILARLLGDSTARELQRIQPLLQMANALDAEISALSAKAHADDRLNHFRPVTRREAYQADVTYGTVSEFGFDYLRDNMALRPEDLGQRELGYAIVDEVDFILIDEARTPLIISGMVEGSTKKYYDFARLVERMVDSRH